MTKLKDIAKHCNMSVTQVSRALNNHSDVSEKTRRKVVQAAKELGYVKNMLASGLANKASNQMAVIIDGINNMATELSDSNVLAILSGAHEYARQYGLSLAVYLKSREDSMEYRAFCLQRGIQGLVIYGCDYDDKDFVELMDSDFPAVVIDIPVEKKNKGCVVVNNAYYAQFAVNHLIQCGCEGIALISGKVHSHVTLERESGYRLALHSHGLEINEGLIVHADFDIGMARAKAAELLQQFPCIDGFFCMSDHMAVGCMEAVAAAGKRVPGDVKVFGFDDLSIGRYLSPCLTSIRQDFVNKGFGAVRLLTKILANENTERTVVVPCEPVIRESAGFPEGQ